MEKSILVAIITACGSILVAAITFYLTKRHQFYVERQQEKLDHYKMLLSAISGLAADGTNKDEANKRFALAVNTIALVAPQYVINVLMNFFDEIKSSNTNKSLKRHDQLLKELLLAIRKDLGFSDKDDISSFRFHLVSSGTKNQDENEGGSDG